MGGSTSRFDAKSILDGSLEGCRIIVTGGSSGLGLESAKLLTSKGATVVLTSRTQSRLDAAAAAVTKAAGGKGAVETKPLDLSSFKSVNEFADWYIAEHGSKPLHVLLNNAGVMAFPDRRVSADGFEMQMATNHLGHFLLTARMLPVLLRTEGSRIVNVSSIAHTMTDDPDGTGCTDVATRDPLRAASTTGASSAEGKYQPWKQYARTKMANLQFTLALNQRLDAAGRGGVKGVRAMSAHPGYSATDLQSTSGSMGGTVGAAIANTLFAQSAAMGALPLVMACVGDEVEAGDLVGPKGTQHMAGYPVVHEPDPRALVRESADALWTASVEATGAEWPDLDATTEEAMAEAAASSRG
jgi:NAD(P)-dependent dehydrogenase (short-subunit alcohol dehydrogenase family)